MNKRHLIPVAIAMLIMGTSVLAQDASGERKAGPRGSGPSRQGVLKRLGLSKEQLDQIRAINAENRSALDASQKRLRDSERLLDEAIYGDGVDESVISARVAESQAAHAEMLRLRTMTEYRIRRLLNPDQLKVFRELRRLREAMPERPMRPRPFDRRQGPRPGDQRRGAEPPKQGI